MHAHPIRRDRRRRIAAAAAAVVIATAGLGIMSLITHPSTRIAPGQGTTLAMPTLAANRSAAPRRDPIGGDAGQPPSPAPSPSAGGAGQAGWPFGSGVLVADRGNGRLLVVDDHGQVVWHFPRAGALPAGQHFSADDAFFSPDGRTIVANDETHETIDRIDVATGRLVWQYGHYGRAGSVVGFLHTPDDAYPLANGDVVVADIRNCRILEIAPDKTMRRQWGHTGVCRDEPPYAFAEPNGDTPLPDGGLLVTEITGSRVVRLAADGSVVFDIHVPVAYPSDAQLDADGNVVVADYSAHGQVVAVDPHGQVVWRYDPRSGPGRLDHPSLATPLANGLVAVNDDFRQRLVVIDPHTGAIVWQYGRTDAAGRSGGRLDTPDGHEPVPPGISF